MLLKAFLAILGIMMFSSSVVAASALTEGYQSTDPLSVGTVVSIAVGSSTSVEATTTSNDSRMVGVVADSSNSIIDLQSKGTNLRVAISGEAQVLVTDANGDIKTGDSLVISGLDGIAAKDTTTSTATKYIGVAQAPFSSSSSNAQSTSVKLSNGQTKTVHVGTISVNILISDRKSQQPKPRSFLANLGQRITGRQVSSFRVVASGIVLLAVIIITGWIFNASIRGSFISLGRNPLAKISIVTNLMRAIIIALVVFAVGLAAAYLFLVL